MNSVNLYLQKIANAMAFTSEGILSKVLQVNSSWLPVMDPGILMPLYTYPCFCPESRE